MSNTDKEIYDQLWDEYYKRDKIDWLKGYIRETIDSTAWRYTDRIILSKEHLNMILDGLNKL